MELTSSRKRINTPRDSSQSIVCEGLFSVVARLAGMSGLTNLRPSTRGTDGGKSSPGNNSTDSNTSAMLDLKNNRKRAEGDLQLLANRIALLRAEESKALGKISETKARAKEIVAYKKRNESDLQVRMTSNVVKDMEIKAIQSKVSKDKRKTEVSLAFSRKNLEEDRKVKASAAKIEKERMEGIARANRVAAVEERKQKALMVKKAEELRKKKIKEEKEKKEAAAQREYLKRMEDERRKTEEAENLISKLEKEELALIERLKSAQALQQEAYSALQTSLDL